MILAFDAHYQDTGSRLVAAIFQDWTDAEASTLKTWTFGPAADYAPGQFYLRELPLIMAALADFDLAKVTAIIVDGYVYLNDQGRLGLGGHLYNELDGKIPVIGIAKSYFRDTNAEAVLRGESKKPLYVTSLGMPQAEAAAHLRSMAGPYRMPDILAAVDRGTKG
jgi:deoxyinosine 3'endonuclease (endonuclease V)